MECKLYKVDPARRYWIVRAGTEAAYFEIFKKFKVIAIGHANEVLSGFSISENSEILQDDKIDKIIDMHTASYSGKLGSDKSKGVNQHGQLKKFMKNMSKGDIVLTVSPSVVMAGRVESGPYLGEEDLKNDNVSGKNHACDYKVRRKMIWARPYRRDRLPYVLERVLRNPSSVFEVSQVEDISILNHWISPFHVSGNMLYVSSRIEQKDKIGNRSMSRYSALLDKVELVSELVAKAVQSKTLESVRNDELDALSKSYVYKMTTKQAFMSPGDHFFQLPGDKLKLILCAVIFASFFEADVALSDEELKLLNGYSQDQVVASVNELGLYKEFKVLKPLLQLELADPDGKLLNDKDDNTQYEGVDSLFPPNETSDKNPM